MAGKAPRGRRPWLDEFQKRGDGEYVYQGSHKKFDAPAGRYARFRLLFGLCAAAAAAAVIASGCLRVGLLDRTAYVMLPYLLEVLLTAAFVWSAVRLLANGELLRGYVYRQTVLRLPKLGVALAGAAAATLVCAAVFAALHRPVLPGVWVYFALQAVVLAASLCGVRLLKKTEWTDV